MSKQPPPAPTASTIGPCPTIIQISRTPRHWKITQHLRNVTVHVDESEQDDERHSNNAEAYMVYSFCLKYVFVSQKQRKGALQS